MIISIASGKGGTGKTTISTAICMAYDKDVTFLDCDVEEPNSHLFIQPELTIRKTATVKIPKVYEDVCSGCGKCKTACRFNAIIIMNRKAIIYPELCHSCGGCLIICPKNAITEMANPIGEIISGKIGDIHYYEGVLKISQAMSPPLIKLVKANISKINMTIIDCPPGTSCPMATAIKGSDYVILIAEPTIFGLNDLILAVETIRIMNIKIGVIINKAENNDFLIEEYCKQENIEVLLKIPNERKIAVAYSNGLSIFTELPELKEKLKNMINKIEAYVNG